MMHNQTRANRVNNVTRGGQVTMNNFHMWVQVTKVLALVFLGCVVTIGFFILYFTVPIDTYHLIGYFYIAKLKLLLPNAATATMHMRWHGTIFYGHAMDVVNNAHIQYLVYDFYQKLFTALFFGIAGACPITWFVHHYFIKQGKELSQDKFVRGMQLESPLSLEKQLKKRGESSDFQFDKKFIFKKDFEVQHMLLDGTTGSGKSVALRKLLLWIRKRGDKAIIYDKGCTYISKFYNPDTDFLMNPFDERCVNWDVWCDAVADTDFENMASALIPMHGEGDPFWVSAARSIFASTAMMMSSETDRSIVKLLEVMLKSKLENLSQYLEGTESASLVSDKIQKTAISIKSVLATYIKSLRFLQGLDVDEAGQPRSKFSIRDWITNDSENGWLFISSNAEQHASLRPLISMWLSIASTSILGLSEDFNRRIWVIVDEAPSLHKLPELPETIAEVRKFGGCYVLGIQSVAQLRKVYGTNAANEIFDLLNTRLFFRSPSNEMAAITSKELGEIELEICKDNRSVGPNAIRDGMTFGFQNVTRAIVTSSEVMKLPDLSFYLRTPGEYPIVKMDMHFDHFESIARAFIKRKTSRTEITEKIKYIDALCAHYQLGCLTQLDKKTRDQLFAMQEDTYDNKEKALLDMKSSVAKINKKNVDDSTPVNPEELVMNDEVDITL